MARKAHEAEINRAFNHGKLGYRADVRRRLGYRAHHIYAWKQVSAAGGENEAQALRQLGIKSPVKKLVAV